MTNGLLPQHRHRPGYKWPEQTLWDDVAAHARLRGGATAVAAEDGTLTYRQLEHTTQAVAAGYQKMGVGPGDVVVVQLPPSSAFVAAFLAAERLGATVSPVLPSIGGLAFDNLVDLRRRQLVGRRRLRSRESASLQPIPCARRVGTRRGLTPAPLSLRARP